jgi:hydrogenase expression/formation protein HypC
MCIGIPMRVLESSEATALCEGRGEQRRINMLMVGNCPPGSWVMTFLGAAREILTEEDAAEINRTLDELEAVLRGDLAPDFLLVR